MLPFSVTIPATVPQRSEIPEGLNELPCICIVVRLMAKIQVYWRVTHVMCHMLGDSILQQFCCENLKFLGGMISPNMLAYFKLTL